MTGPRFSSLARFLSGLFRGRERRRAPDLGVVLAASVVIGLLAGLGSIGFFFLLELAKYLLLDLLAGWRPPHPVGEPPHFGIGTTPFRPWLLLLLPALGGLVGGLIVARFAPEAEGHGTDAAIDAYHHRQGRIRGRVPLVKAVASAITIGTGGSAGREGPIAQIGAGLASLLAQRLKLARRDRAVLMAAGLAGGVGAIFHAPLAGAVFACEVMYRELDLEHEVLVPSFISSAVAYSVFSTVFGWDPLFATPDFGYHEPLHLIGYLVLGVVVAFAAKGFIRLFGLVHGLFASLLLPRAIKPALGGLLTGLVALVAWKLSDKGLGYGVLSSGYGVLQEGFTEPAAIGVTTFLLVAVGKMLTTSFSVGSGGSGGVFGPSVVIGGALGGAVGLLVDRALPAAEVHPGAFVMVGMAGFFAAAGHAPVSTIIMVGEMTGNHHLLVPSMLTCVVAYLLVGRDTIFGSQLRGRLEAPAKAGNMMTAVLERISVSQALKTLGERRLQVVEPSTTLRELVDLSGHDVQDAFPVLEANGELVGVVEGRSLRFAMAEDLGELALAASLASEPVTLSEGEHLLEALELMGRSGREEVVVLSSGEEGRPIATLSRSDVVTAYNRRMTAELDAD
ncbi:MAG: chloride channel protein [Acidobacteriota bacterium]